MIRKQSARLSITSAVAVMPNWTNGFQTKEGITAIYSSTGVDVAYRLKGINKLNLSGPVLPAIFNDKITKWNEPKIANLNPKAKLPGTRISVVYPGEAGGQSQIFTSYLAKVAGNRSESVAVAHFKAGTTAAGDRGVGAKAYPLSTFGFAVVPHDAPQKGFVEQFLNYAVGPGRDLGAAVDIAPLPKAAARAAIGAL